MGDLPNQEDDRVGQVIKLTFYDFYGFKGAPFTHHKSGLLSDNIGNIVCFWALRGVMVG